MSGRCFRQLLLLLTTALLGGCTAGKGALFVTVNTVAGTSVRGVERLRVVIDNAGQMSSPVVITVDGAPVDLPPERTFQLRFDRTRSGVATLRIDALGAANQVLASGAEDTMLVPGQEVPVTVLLPGAADGDGGIDMVVDLGQGGDLRGADLTLPPDLAVPGDLIALPDLTPCGVPTLPPDAGVRLHVRPGGTSDAGTAGAPFGTIQAAVNAAQAAGGGATLLIEEGNYSESIFVAGQIALRGGYFQSFTCHNSGVHPTVITSDRPDSPAVAITTSTQGEVLLDGLRLEGASSGITSVGLTIDGPAQPTIRSCQIHGHANLTSPLTGTSLAVRSTDATPTFEQCQLHSGAANSYSAAAQLCSNSKVVFTESTIDALVGASNVRHTAIGNVGCSNSLMFDLTLTRCRVLTAGGASAAESRVIEVDSDTSNLIVIQGSALTCTGRCEHVLYTATGATVTITASTLWASPVDSAQAISSQFGLSLNLYDSIVVAAVPIGTATVSTSLNNLFYGAAPDLIQSNAMGTVDLAAYRTSHGDGMTQFGDPMLASDHQKLTSSSMRAIDLASQCWFPVDFENDPRPGTTSSKCDIGADELP